MTIEAYLCALDVRLQGRASQRRRILDEVRDHLEQVAASERAGGTEAGSAEEFAVQRFGDVDLIAGQFAAAWRGLSRGGRIALAWLSVAAASAASWALTWTRADPVPSLIALAEAGPAPTPVYRMAPLMPASAPRSARSHRDAVWGPMGPASGAPREQAPIAAEPAPPAIELSRLIALALPPPPGKRVAITPMARITPPVPLARASATVRYPQAARWLGIEGDVRLRLHIDRGGQVDDAAVVRSLGFGLDEVALEVVRHLRFHPATDEHGMPVGVYVEWTVHCERPNVSAAMVPVFDRADAPSMRFGRSHI